ncbi:MAG: hypothetical protein RMK19_07775 [Bacteroidia bacterium]|nr:hypothetical protein [Bacteroidia bacterium]MDW8015893.1 hypothetical protein [Bacteroidia bacterium]
MQSVGMAIPLSTLYERLQWVYPLIFDEIVVRCKPPLHEILSQYPKVVHAISHAGSCGWIPPILALLRIAVQEGGQNRKALGIFHRLFYQIKLTRWIMQNIFESKSPPNFAQVIEAFKNGPVNDVALFPEGDNCILGDVYEIRPFRSPKFIELAVATGAPILITVHRGAEEWGRDFYMPSAMLRWLRFIQPSYVRPLIKNPVINLPLRFTRIPKFSLHASLYFPRISYDQLSSRPRERWFQLNEEAQRVKTVMVALLKDMPYV